MSQSSKQIKPEPEPKDKNLLSKLQECVEAKDTVEVLTDSREITGVISTIGSDFIGVTSSVERTVETSSQGQDGVIEKQQVITVFALETFIKFEDLRAVSRVLNTKVK